MSKRQVLCILGVWVMIFVFLGIPSLGMKIAAIITGLLIIALSYNIPPKNIKEKTDNFIENTKDNKTDNKIA